MLHMHSCDTIINGMFNNPQKPYYNQIKLHDTKSQRSSLLQMKKNIYNIKLVPSTVGKETKIKMEENTT